MSTAAHVTRGIFKYASLLAAVFVVGPLVAAVAKPLATATGSFDATLLTASGKGAAAIAYIVAMLGACTVAIVSGVVSTRRVAFFATGLVLAWPAHTLGNAESILRDAHRADAIAAVLTRFSIEAALIAVPLVLVLHIASRLGDANAPASLRAFPDPAALASKDSAIAAAAAAAVGAVVVYFFMPTAYNAQALGASAIAGALGALAAHAAAPRAPLAAAYAGAMLIAVVGPLVARFTAPADPLAAQYAGELMPLALVHPWHVAAGAAMGVPVGDAWARSLIEKHAPTDDTPPAGAPVPKGPTGKDPSLATAATP